MIISIFRFLVKDDHQNWPDFLSTAAFAFNTAYHRAISDYAISPFVCSRSYSALWNNLNPSPPVFYHVESYRTYLCRQNRKIFEFVNHMLRRAGEENERLYHIKFKVQNPGIELGNRVFIKRLAPKQYRLESKYIGPFSMLDKASDSVTVRSLYNNKVATIHLSHVKFCHEGKVIKKRRERRPPRKCESRWELRNKSLRTIEVWCKV